MDHSDALDVQELESVQNQCTVIPEKYDCFSFLNAVTMVNGQRPSSTDFMSIEKEEIWTQNTDIQGKCHVIMEVRIAEMCLQVKEHYEFPAIIRY